MPTFHDRSAIPAESCFCQFRSREDEMPRRYVLPASPQKRESSTTRQQKQGAVGPESEILRKERKTKRSVERRHLQSLQSADCCFFIYRGSSSQCHPSLRKDEFPVFIPSIYFLFLLLLFRKNAFFPELISVSGHLATKVHFRNCRFGSFPFACSSCR